MKARNYNRSVPQMPTVLPLGCNCVPKDPRDGILPGSEGKKAYQLLGLYSSQSRNSGQQHVLSIRSSQQRDCELRRADDESALEIALKKCSFVQSSHQRRRSRDVSSRRTDGAPNGVGNPEAYSPRHTTMKSVADIAPIILLWREAIGGFCRSTSNPSGKCSQTSANGCDKSNFRPVVAARCTRECIRGSIRPANHMIKEDKSGTQGAPKARACDEKQASYDLDLKRQDERINRYPCSTVQPARRLLAHTHDEGSYGQSDESSSAFTRLPAELFAMIAADVPLTSRLVIPQVCRDWAALSTNCVTIWTVLDFLDVAVISVDLVARLLERSGTAPVEVRNLSLHGDIPQSLGQIPHAILLSLVAPVFAHYMARITVLEIELVGYSRTRDLIPALVTPAPLLRQARLLSTSPVWLPPKLFGGRLGAPRLRKLVVRNCDWADHIEPRPPAASVDSVLNCLTHLSLLPSVREAHIVPLLNGFPTIVDIDIGEISMHQSIILAPHIVTRLSIRLNYRLDRNNVQNVTSMSPADMRNISAAYAEGDALPVLLRSNDDADAELRITHSQVKAPKTFALEMRLSRNRRRTVDCMFSQSFHRAVPFLSEGRVFYNVRKLVVSCLELLLRNENPTLPIPFVSSSSLAAASASVVPKWSGLLPNLDEVDITLPPVSVMDSNFVFGNENLRDVLSRSKRVTLRAQAGETYSLSWQTFCLGFTTTAAEPKLWSPESLKLHNVQVSVGLLPDLYLDSIEVRGEESPAC
ncbi:hypothetical protein EXIGLDRAFT_755387 [Exidia glandulosa HHB12029]|uniref:F-box domain-containing protein n=1 Tax=Exidia glandulosa HHB12029 TaxID=1314781 RepID=A0A165C3N2_EXIGL|nr:hypothetical protein EXIGLDRAFT_755387 [Exidia glandulosa HHB12029]